MAMGDISDSYCPFYRALSPVRWVHSGNQIKHENILLTVQKSRMKERRNKGRKQGKETPHDNRFSRQSIIQHWCQHSTNCMQKLFEVLWNQSVSLTWRDSLYRIYSSKVVVFNHW